MKQIPLTPRRWTRAEYDRLVNLGVLHGKPVELVGGQLVVAEPQGSYHASALGAAGDALRAVLPHGWLVRIQMPVALDDESELEPDLAVVRNRGPTTARATRRARPRGGGGGIEPTSTASTRAASTRAAASATTGSSTSSIWHSRYTATLGRIRRRPTAGVTGRSSGWVRRPRSRRSGCRPCVSR